jgi:hypothetical protein
MDTKSKLKNYRVENGTLTVYYRGRNWDQAIDSALRELEKPKPTLFPLSLSRLKLIQKTNSIWMVLKLIENTHSK